MININILINKTRLFFKINTLNHHFKNYEQLSYNDTIIINQDATWVSWKDFSHCMHA